jgi:hypothetical protein
MRLFELKIGEGERMWYDTLTSAMIAMRDYEQGGINCELKIHKIKSKVEQESVKEIIEILNIINK